MAQPASRQAAMTTVNDPSDFMMILLQGRIDVQPSVTRARPAPAR
jgi:hypothetical protein